MYFLPHLYCSLTYIIDFQERAPPRFTMTVPWGALPYILPRDVDHRAWALANPIDFYDRPLLMEAITYKYKKLLQSMPRLPWDDQAPGWEPPPEEVQICTKSYILIGDPITVTTSTKTFTAPTSCAAPTSPVFSPSAIRVMAQFNSLLQHYAAPKESNTNVPVPIATLNQCNTNKPAHIAAPN